VSTTTSSTTTTPAATVTFKINGQEMTVAKGTTVMEAAKKAGIAIPHFCWHPGLSIAGVCRFCMVKVAVPRNGKIEPLPKLEVACNLQPSPGMEVSTDTAEVKDAHKWALEFHLINHPLDCPICDQAGECGLQDYYMEVGKYHSQMTRPKVLKPKALDVGRDLVLDTERCILCSRCVRFEEEVTKTDALGIFDRGDRAVIGTYPGKKIEHNYQTNLVDICPVGAFTSRDFRFKQRVWFLKDKPSICPGCSTGCHVDVYGKPETRSYFRIKPRESAVNGHWMCDSGRENYRHLNPDRRLRGAIVTQGSAQKDASFDEAAAALAAKIASVQPQDVALLVSAQYTCEEYDALFGWFVGKLGVKNVFQWREPTEKRDAFDGLLKRGDENANTQGLLASMKKHGLSASAPANEFDKLAAARPKVVIALAPELPHTFPSLKAQLDKLMELDFVSLWTINGEAAWLKTLKHALPMKGFAEKRGTFLNQAGGAGKLEAPFPCPVTDARDVAEVVAALSSMPSMKSAGAAR
jgi:NADH-quinone oxidoreductase subunit G